MDQPGNDDDVRMHQKTRLEMITEAATLGIARTICAREQNIPPIPDETRLGMVTEMATLGIARILCGQEQNIATIPEGQRWVVAENHHFGGSNRIAESGFQQQQPINRDFLVPPMPFENSIEDDDIIFLQELAPAAQQQQQNAPFGQQPTAEPPISTPRYPPIHNRQVKLSVELYVQWTLEYPEEEGEESMNMLVEKVVKIIGQNFSTLRERLKDRVSRCKKRILAERRQQQHQQTSANNNDNNNASQSQSSYTLAPLVVPKPEQQQIVQDSEEPVPDPVPVPESSDAEFKIAMR